MEEENLECCKRTFGESLKDTAKRLLQDPRIAPRAVAKERLMICESCDRYLPESSQCGICHCNMPLKTTMANMKCPLDKWLEFKGPKQNED